MGGNHKARIPGYATMDDWIPIEVLHFPFRTAAHATRKFTKTSMGGHGRSLAARRPRHRVARRVGLRGRDARRGRALAKGLADGSLTHDTRVRDALRCALAREPFERPLPAVADDVELATEFGEFPAAASRRG